MDAESPEPAPRCPGCNPHRRGQPRHLRRADEPAHRVGHPDQLLTPPTDHRRLEREHLERTQAEFYSSNGGAPGPDRAAADQHRRRHHDPRPWTGRATARAWSVTIGIKGGHPKPRSTCRPRRRHLDVRITLPRAPRRHPEQGTPVGRPQTSSSFKDNIYACSSRQRQPGLRQPATPAGWRSRRGPGERPPSHRHSDRLRRQDQQRGDVFASGRPPATAHRGARSRPPAARAGARRSRRDHLRQLRHRYPVMRPPPRPDLHLGRRLQDGHPNNVYVTWTDRTGVTGCKAPATSPAPTSPDVRPRIWFAARPTAARRGPPR